VEYYRRQSPDKTRSGNPDAAADAGVETAGGLRRLLPFPSSLDVATLAPLMHGRKLPIPQITEAQPTVLASGSDAVPIVSEAASILDEEMAKGVLAARHVSPVSGERNPAQIGTVLRQVHEVIDNIARMWPSVQAASARRIGASVVPGNSGNNDTLPTLKPSSRLRPGERCTVSMLLRNREDHTVRLTPMSTDLISGTGGRISSQLVEFEPGDVRLESGEEKDLLGRIAVPVDAPSGCYSGLLVVGGVDYLRALITITIE
jgi:hypothetical protein